MNYLDVYFSRVNHFGDTTAERIKNSGIVAFEKWMAQSPFTVVNLSVERGFYFSGIIETSKDKAEEKIMFLYVALDIPVKVGDILTWKQDNGTIEKWILLQQVHKVHPTYQTFKIIKCNFELKWIDFNGYLRKSWAYAVSSVDSKVKSNFRMWHSLVSPQPNKFAEVIMPRPIFKEGSEDLNRLMRGITFIIENEGWQIIECDWTSVEGIAYMSLTETKVNYEYDDRDIDVAEADRYKFPTLPTLYKVGDTIEPQFEHDTLNQWEIQLTKPADCDFIDDDFVAIGPGQCIITMALKNRPSVTKDVEIIISNVNEEILYIRGADEVKLDRYVTYELVNETDNEVVVGTVNFTVENITEEKIPLSNLIPAYDTNNNVLPYATVLHANAKNKLGEVTLTAEYNGNIYTKVVKIVPLW